MIKQVTLIISTYIDRAHSIYFLIILYEFLHNIIGDDFQHIKTLQKVDVKQNVLKVLDWTTY